MPERSSVAQVSQIGVETTPGTAVAATKRLGSLSLTPSIQNDTNPFRPQGMKFPALVIQNMEWAEVGVEGVPTYEEVIYPLSGAMNVATVNEVMDGATPTGAFEWTFTPATFGADTPKTFTLENGQEGVQAERLAHLLFTEFGLEISRGEVSLSGSAIAKRVEAAFDPTNGLSLGDLNPVTPGQFSVYVVDDPANFEDTPGHTDATNLLGRVIQANPSISDRYTPAWFVNSAETSFTTWVENADGASAEFGLTVEADSDGMSWLNRMREGTTHFIRVEAVGPQIYDAGTSPDLRHLFQWDMAVKVNEADDWSDEDGIYAIPWTLQPVHDGGWGKAMTVKVRNTVATL